VKGAPPDAPPAAPRMLALARLTFWLLAAGLVLAIGGAARIVARRAGWRAGERLPVLFHRLACAALALRVTTHGAPAAGRPQLVAANHVSWLDICVLGASRPVEFLAKTEVGAGGLARALLALQGVAFVDRRRRRCIPDVNAQLARRMRAGAAMILFAEATTGDGNRVLRFRSSHFEAIRQTLQPGGGAAFVQPVYVAYSRRAGLPLGRAGRSFVAWYGDMTFFNHFWRLLRDGPIDCDLYYGPPIAVRGDLDRKALARSAEAAVRELALQAHRSGPPAAIFARREKS
jgi:1-acyl-sn-glycerol-3-phosphate acyltransferase